MIEVSAKRYKPETSDYLYGLLLTSRTVIAIIKNNPKIIVFPAGKLTFIHNFKRYQFAFQFHAN